MGEMADYILDTFGDEPLYEYGGLIACRCCGKNGLHWGQREDGKWILVDDMQKMHKCAVNPLKT